VFNFILAISFDVKKIFVYSVKEHRSLNFKALAVIVSSVLEAVCKALEEWVNRFGVACLFLRTFRVV